jgi:hypothetical protein
MSDMVISPVFPSFGFKYVLIDLAGPMFLLEDDPTLDSGLSDALLLISSSTSTSSYSST